MQFQSVFRENYTISKLLYKSNSVFMMRMSFSCFLPDILRFRVPGQAAHLFVVTAAVKDEGHPKS